MRFSVLAGRRRILSIEVCARPGDAEPFFGAFQDTLPPVGAGDGADDLHAGGKVVAGEGDVLRALFGVDSGGDLDEIGHEEASFPHLIGA